MPKVHAPRRHTRTSAPSNARTRVVRIGRRGYRDTQLGRTMQSWDGFKRRALGVAGYTRPAGDRSCGGGGAPMTSAQGMRNGTRIDNDMTRIVNEARRVAGGASVIAQTHIELALRRLRPSERTRAMLRCLFEHGIVPQRAQPVYYSIDCNSATAGDLECRHATTGETWIVECKSGGSGGASGTFPAPYTHIPLTEHNLHLAQVAYQRILWRTSDYNRGAAALAPAPRAALLRADNRSPPEVHFTAFDPAANPAHTHILKMVTERLMQLR